MTRLEIKVAPASSEYGGVEFLAGEIFAGRKHNGVVVMGRRLGFVRYLFERVCADGFICLVLHVSGARILGFFLLSI